MSAEYFRGRAGDFAISKIKQYREELEFQQQGNTESSFFLTLIPVKLLSLKIKEWLRIKLPANHF